MARIYSQRLTQLRGEVTHVASDSCRPVYFVRRHRVGNSSRLPQPTEHWVSDHRVWRTRMAIGKQPGDAGSHGLNPIPSINERTAIVDSHILPDNLWVQLLLARTGNVIQAGLILIGLIAIERSVNSIRIVGDQR